MKGIGTGVGWIAIDFAQDTAGTLGFGNKEQVLI